MSSSQQMRKRAEEMARGRVSQTQEELDVLSPESSMELVHELLVHQIELEMQNDELRRTQLELEVSRARYFDLYDLAPVGYLTLDEKGIILEANLTAATLLGVARGALVKKGISAFIFHEDQDIFYRQRRQLSETGASQKFELRLMRKDGSHFWTQMEGTATQDADGAPFYRVVVSDITERKLTEERERLLASEHETRMRAEEAVRARDAFISIASHELNTPVTSLQGYAQLILRDLSKNGVVDPERLSKAMERIVRQSKRLTRLSEQLLSLSHLQSERLNLSREQTSLSELVGRAVEDEQYSHPERNIELHDSGMVLAYVDPVRMEQVMVNLLENAIKFSPKDSKVEVDLGVSEPGWVRIAVRDRGVGISEEEREKIFEKYYQAHPERHLGGMGIGLFLSREVVEMHGGTIAVEQADGVGSRFVIRIPLNGE